MAFSRYLPSITNVSDISANHGISGSEITQGIARCEISEIIYAESEDLTLPDVSLLDHVRIFSVYCMYA